MRESAEEDFMEFVDSWSGIVYCEYCNQGFPNHDMFGAHRKASDVAEVREFNPRTGYDGVTVIEPGQWSGSWTVGHEPCDGHKEVVDDE